MWLLPNPDILLGSDASMAMAPLLHSLGNLRSLVKSRIKNLCVCFDEYMLHKKYSKELVKNSFFQLRILSKLKCIISTKELEMIIHAFVSSRLDYCSSLFMCLNKKEVALLH